MTGLSHVAGALSAARWETGTAASEFFIVLEDSPDLDCGGRYEEGYAVFGRVVAGMSVVSSINTLDTNQPTTIDYMKGQAIAPVPMRIARL
jgi:peptidyl-prolyl cis-trans isomerase A (cyclophilin A)